MPEFLLNAFSKIGSRYSTGVQQSFQMIFVWMLYNKNWPSYCVPNGEKRVCSRKQKSGPLASLDIDAWASWTWSYKKTGQLASLDIDAWASWTWPYKKTVAVQLPNFVNFCCEYLLSNKCTERKIILFWFFMFFLVDAHLKG